MLQFAKNIAVGMAICIGLHACPFGLSSTSAHTSIPFRTVNGYILVVNVSVNGRGSYDFMLDTGTNTSLIEPDLIASLGVRPVDRITLSTLTVSAPLPRYFLESISLGGVDMHHVEVLGQSLSALRGPDRRIRGVLGLSALREFSFQIDNVHKRFDLLTDEEVSRFKNQNRVLVEIAQDRILVPVTARAAPGSTWKLMLDSGVSQVFLLEQRILNTGSVSSGRKQSAQFPGATGAAAITRVTTNLSEGSAATLKIDSLEVGPVRFSHLPVVVVGAKMLSPPPGADGLLPVSLFRLILFDRTTSSIFLEAN